MKYIMNYDLFYLIIIQNHIRNWFYTPYTHGHVLF